MYNDRPQIVVVGIKPPPNPLLAIFDPWGGFVPPGGGLILAKGWFYPPKGVVLSPHWVISGGGGGYCPFGVALSPLFGDFIPIGRWGGVVTSSGAEGYAPSLC